MTKVYVQQLSGQETSATSDCCLTETTDLPTAACPVVYSGGASEIQKITILLFLFYAWSQPLLLSSSLSSIYYARGQHKNSNNVHNKNIKE